ncbi:MAG: hypothetical protein WC453_02545 [Patescibacteria group bacterium]
MKKIMLLATISVLFLSACSGSLVNMQAEYAGIEEMGFISVFAPDQSVNCKRAIVTATLDGVAVSDTVDVVYMRSQGKVGIGGSAYGPDMVIKYHDLTKTSYKLPLGRSDLQKFAAAAKWTFQPL